MDQLGNVLRMAREKQGLSLSDIQQLTKIRTRYLEAIEEGDMSSLPGIVYAKGFIKSYAEQVGLDGQTLLEEHGLAAPEPDQLLERPVQSTPMRRKSSSLSPQTKSYLLQVTIVLVLLCLVVVAFQFVIKRAPRSPLSPAASSQLNLDGNTLANAPVAGSTNATNVPNSTNNPGVAPAAQPLSPTDKSGNTSTYSVPADTPLTLTITATSGDCWINVTSDQKEVEQLILTKGQSKQYTATSQLLIDTGASAYITMTIGKQSVVSEQVLADYKFLFRHTQ
ncbi:MAG: hypothetical protein JWN30_955 [Bacilli bacterium]|nr:hypothetical protein [Bacilli bacterium]